MSLITNLKNWRSALAGGGVAGDLGLLLAFVVNIRSMSTSELKISLENTREDLAMLREDFVELYQKYGRLQEVYETLASAYWDEPMVGSIKGMNGRYVVANKKFMQDLVEGKGLDPDRIIGYNDYEIWGDSARADLYRAHDLEVLRAGRMMEFQEDIKIGGRIQHYISRKYPVYNTRGDKLGVGGVAIEDCD